MGGGCMRVSGPRFTGSFLAAGDSPEMVVVPLLKATEEDNLRLLVTKPLDGLRFIPFANGEGMDELRGVHYWVGRALSGKFAKRFLSEYFGLDQLRENAPQDVLDRQVNTALQRRLGTNYMENAALYSAVDRFVKDNRMFEPMVDLTNKDQLEWAQAADAGDPWAVNDDDWRGDEHPMSDGDESWDTGRPEWRSSDSDDHEAA